MAEYVLQFISGKYRGGEFPLDPGKEIVIGRASDLDMVLVEDMVSRKHARIKYDPDEIFIEDLGSTNGTFVNGERVKRKRIKEGDRILVGTSILKLIRKDQSRENTPPPAQAKPSKEPSSPPVAKPKPPPLEDEEMPPPPPSFEPEENDTLSTPPPGKGASKPKKDQPDLLANIEIAEEFEEEMPPPPPPEPDLAEKIPPPPKDMGIDDDLADLLEPVDKRMDAVAPVKKADKEPSKPSVPDKLAAAESMVNAEDEIEVLPHEKPAPVKEKQKPAPEKSPAPKKEASQPAATPAEPPPDDKMAKRGKATMTGDIQEVPVPDLMQLFTMTKKNGTCYIDTENDIGRIYFKEGQIYFAEIESIPELEPYKAVLRILTWPKGTFAMCTESPKEYEKPLTVSTNNIVMEAVAQHDELQHLGALPPYSAAIRLVLPPPTPFKELPPEALDALEHILQATVVLQVLNMHKGSDLEAMRGIMALKEKGIIEFES